MGRYDGLHSFYAIYQTHRSLDTHFNSMDRLVKKRWSHQLRFLSPLNANASIMQLISITYLCYKCLKRISARKVVEHWKWLNIGSGWRQQATRSSRHQVQSARLFQGNQDAFVIQRLEEHCITRGTKLVSANMDAFGIFCLKGLYHTSHSKLFTTPSIAIDDVEPSY